LAAARTLARRWKDAGKTLLSCSAEGLVNLGEKNDGSGLQKWMFEGIGPSAFTVSVVGGKPDKKVLMCTKANSVGLCDGWLCDNSSGDE